MFRYIQIFYNSFLDMGSQFPLFCIEYDILKYKYMP